MDFHFDRGQEKMKEVYINTRVFSGVDCLEHLRELKNKKVWLICDAFLVDNGTVDELTNKIDSTNQVTICKDVIPDPPLENVATGVANLLKLQPDVVIAFGGGSAIDTAKGILYFASNAGYKKEVLFIAVPTTSGTGSEVTSVTVITDKALQTKHLIADHSMLPNEVLLAPQFTASVPPAITANTGVDVLTHVIEAYVASNSNAYSDALAEKGVEMVFDYLEKCYFNGSDMDARSKMQEASNIAGTSFNIAGLGMNHAIAHQLGGMFHIPHGLANALILTEVIKRNASDAYMKSRYACLARKNGFATKQDSDDVAVQCLCDKIDECKRNMKMPMRISECKVDGNELRSKLSELSDNALKDGCVKTARMVFSKQDIERILLNVL